MKDCGSGVNRGAFSAPIGEASIRSGTVPGALIIGCRQCPRGPIKDDGTLRCRLKPALVQPRGGSYLGQQPHVQAPFRPRPAEDISAVLAVPDKWRFQVDDRPEGR